MAWRGIFIIAALSGVMIAGYGIWHRTLCHRDIDCLKQRDEWLQQRLDRAVPLFITRDKVNDAELSIIDAKTEAMLLLSTVMQGAADFERFHAQQRANGPISCAVVANGQNLLGSGYGALIDSYTYVFRMNNAPTKRFSDDVGSKTTFNVINSHQTIQPRITPDVYTILWDEGESLGELFLRVGKRFTEQHVLEGPKPRKILIFDPVFGRRYMLERWFASDRNSESEEWPSTGLYAVVLALHLCNTVDTFGFGPTPEGQWLHYYGQGQAVWVGHRPDYQESLLDELARRHVIRRFMGK